MRERFKHAVVGTPLEPFARAVWRRIRPPADDLNARYDADLEVVMRRVLDRSSSCIDAGAHAGHFLRLMVGFAPEGRHVAFEPLPHYASGLRREFPDVDVREQALADATGVLPFRAVPGSSVACSGFARRPWDTYPEEGVEIIDVDVVRLDDLFDPGRIFRFVKVDVEGAELGLFRGGRELLRRSRPYIGFENSSDPAQIYEVLVDEIDLRLSLMHEWLAGAPPLSRDRFLDEVLSERHYFFLAHP